MLGSGSTNVLLVPEVTKCFTVPLDFSKECTTVLPVPGALSGSWHPHEITKLFEDTLLDNFHNDIKEKYGSN